MYYVAIVNNQPYIFETLEERDQFLKRFNAKLKFHFRAIIKC